MAEDCADVATSGGQVDGGEAAVLADDGEQAGRRRGGGPQPQVRARSAAARSSSVRMLNSFSAKPTPAGTRS